MADKESAAARRKQRVLVVDDERAMAEMLADGLMERGFEAVPVHQGERALALLESSPIDAVVTDLRMSPVDGFALLACSRRLEPERPVIIMTAFSGVEGAVEAIRQGAHHYLAKPFPLDELCIFLTRALEEVATRREARTLRRALGKNVSSSMIAKSAAMRCVLDLVARVAPSTAAVLITGETGTGKGHVAAALHAGSSRAAAPFVAVNCAALPAALLESELFGHVRGAFTGATSDRAGLLAEADGGSLFLDEIGDMPLALQAKLLRALDDGRVRPVGSNQERAVDVRLIAATNRNLRQRVADGAFREDLLYRLDVIAIELPPLRTRPEDIPALIEHFFAEARQRYPDAVARRFTRDASDALLAHTWPGNVRELSHVMERAVLLADSAEVGPDVLPAPLQLLIQPRRPATFHELVPIRELQRSYAAWALEQLSNNRTRTAEKLGIDYKTLARLVEPADSQEVTDVPVHSRSPR